MANFLLPSSFIPPPSAANPLQIDQGWVMAGGGALTEVYPAMKQLQGHSHQLKRKEQQKV